MNGFPNLSVPGCSSAHVCHNSLFAADNVPHFRASHPRIARDRGCVVRIRLTGLPRRRAVPIPFQTEKITPPIWPRISATPAPNNTDAISKSSLFKVVLKPALEATMKLVHLVMVLEFLATTILLN